MSKNEINNKEWNLVLKQRKKFEKQYNKEPFTYTKITKNKHDIECCSICGITQDIGGCYECKMEKEKK